MPYLVQREHILLTVVALSPSSKGYRLFFEFMLQIVSGSSVCLKFDWILNFCNRSILMTFD